MKIISRAILAFLTASLLVHSEEKSSIEPAETATTPTTARILGRIPDGTPPPPAPPTPEFHIPAQDILDTTTHQQGGRTITFQKIKPIALPPPPPPPPAATTVGEPDAGFSQRLATYQEAHPGNDLLFLSATVFRAKDSPPRTLVRWWPQGGKETITFWSSADFALIAGGINSFADTAGDTHHLLMGWGNVNIDRMAKLSAAKGKEYDAPELPEFPAGKATFEITGDYQPTAEELIVIQSLHDVYHSELVKLTSAHQGRERARIEREAALKANPPQPKNITLNYWRTEKPAANKKGAAQ